MPRYAASHGAWPEKHGSRAAPMWVRRPAAILRAH